MSHARLGPSNARWPNCPGSVREEERYEDVSSAAAIDGTGSHLLLEMCLQNGVQAVQYDQQIIGVGHPDNPNGWLVAPDRIARVQICLDYVSRRVRELTEMYPDSIITVESEGKSDPGGMFGRDDWWGTCDITILCRDKHLGEALFIEVCDYKDGQGFVSVKDSTQLIAYLTGKMRPFIASGPEKVRPFLPHKVKDCRRTIVQPKTSPPIRYECSLTADTGQGASPSEVVASAIKLADAAYATDDPNAPLIPGKHCTWCKANPKRGGHCTAETDQSIKKVTDMSTEIIATDNQSAFEYIGQVVADPKSLTENQLSELMSAKDALMAAFDKCEQEIEQRIRAGITVPGYAILPSRGSRVWNEPEEEVVKKLKARRLTMNDIYPKKLISPAAALALDKLTEQQKNKIEEELISFKAGKDKLKKVSHTVVQSDTKDVNSMFGDIAEPEISFL